MKPSSAGRPIASTHYRADFPETDDAAWGRSLVVRSVDGRVEQTLRKL